jgi:hypothetical protein
MFLDSEFGSGPQTQTTVPLATQRPSSLCFDADVAKQAGVQCALLVKYVECSTRKRVEATPKKKLWVYKTQAQLADELGMTVKQVRLATTKLKRLRIVTTAKKAKHQRCHVLSYNFCEQTAFFAARAKARRWHFRSEDATRGATVLR